MIIMEAMNKSVDEIRMVAMQLSLSERAALVHDLTSFMDLHVPFLTFEATPPLVTLWHEQI